MKLGAQALAACAGLTLLVGEVRHDLLGHRPGLWSIAAEGKLTRWVEIHNLDEAKRSGLFHVEVLGRRQGDPTWKIQHIAPHLAVTAAALDRSVVKPLKRGAVYPETFDSAYAAWRKAKSEGGNAPVCESTVVECIRK